jgi:16S rRNA (adenine1518-N6/adenine1519-N6)-dimethyltransferase
VTDSHISTIKLIKSHGIKPDIRLGQNFLVDESYIDKIIKTASIKNDESILEIGAGIGNLTRKIAVYDCRIVAVEIDKRLIPAFHQVTSEFKNIQLIQGNILELDLKKLFLRDFKVIANIPYYISSAVIRYLTETKFQPKHMVLTLQKEIAERICQNPGNYSLLALSVQIFGKPKIQFHVPAGAFYPKPEVNSAVITIEKHPDTMVPEKILPLLFQLAKAGFSQKRKTLRNSLAGGMHWSTDLTRELLIMAGINPHRRAETLSIDEWVSLSTVIAKSDHVPHI